MGKEIRIPRTTAMFVTGLASILRDRLELHVTEHEHWTFEHVAFWRECGQPGRCRMHGVSRSYLEKLARKGRVDDALTWDCYPYRINAYLAAGRVGTPDGLIELRARLEQVQSDAIGELFDVQVWAKRPDGRVLSGRFGLFADGRAYPSNRPAVSRPPNKIAFWRSDWRAEDELYLTAIRDRARMRVRHLRHRSP